MPRKRMAPASKSTDPVREEMLHRLHARAREARAGVAHGVGDLKQTVADPLVHNVCKLSKRLSQGVISDGEAGNLRRLQKLYEECNYDMAELLKRVGLDDAAVPDVMRAMAQLQASNASGSTALRSAATDVVTSLAAKGLR